MSDSRSCYEMEAKLITIVVIICSVSNNANFIPYVVIKDGAILGSNRQTLGGKPYVAFEGIPYAEKPIGDLRFAEPHRVQPWPGIRNGTVVQNACPQPFNGAIVGNEDCLYINVYVPQYVIQKHRWKQLLNVIVFIHGGSFIYFTGNTAGPQYLFDYDDTCIFVTFNYRLSILGFLSFGDKIVPGNNGMKDQVAALQWVKRNIMYFGGNPKKVTIAGLSAGAASVQFHMISPLSKGLFHNAISSSGAVLTPWAVSTNVTSKSLEVAAGLGCPITNSAETVKCLKMIPAETITASVVQYHTYFYTPITPFGVVVEPCIEGAFLAQHPRELLTKGRLNDVPWLVTMNTDEGLYPAVANLANPVEMGNLTSNWRRIFEPLLHLEYTIPKNLLPMVINDIKEFYFGSRQISYNVATNFVQMLTDRTFVNGITSAAQLQAARCKAPVYIYKFNYRGRHSTTEFFTQSAVNYGVSHGDDSLYVIYDSVWQPLENKTVIDQHMTKLISTIWTTFAKYGVPGVSYNQWFPLPCNQDLLIYMNIDSPYDVQIKYSNEQTARKFWSSLPFIPLDGYNNTCAMSNNARLKD